MRKVVINTKHGGFGLSREAFIEWARRKDFGIVETKRGEESFFHAMWAVTYRPFSEEFEMYDRERHDGHDLISDHDMNRDDPDLVAVVEEYGEGANTRYSKLKVVEIPEDVEWEIQEYDGAEWVAEKHRTWS